MPLDSSAPVSDVSNRSVISILGPTATGKTATTFAFVEAVQRLKIYDLIRVISVDSRQVFEDIPIISGVDVPSQFHHHKESSSPYFSHQKNDSMVELHGIQMIRADAPWSLADFQNFALPLIYDTWQKSGLVVLVGGTGLYHQRLFSSQLKQHPGPNPELRKKLRHLPLSKLQTKAEQTDFESFSVLTESDKQNKRRLIRLIERAQKREIDPDDTAVDLEGVRTPETHVKVVLDADRGYISSKINQRVTKRIKQGAREEVSRLMKRYTDHTLPIFSATGVREVMTWINQEIDQNTCHTLWTIRERQYAKRQQTWFAKFAQDARWFFVEADYTNQSSNKAVEYLINAIS